MYEAIWIGFQIPRKLFSFEKLSLLSSQNFFITVQFMTALTRLLNQLLINLWRNLLELSDTIAANLCCLVSRLIVTDLIKALLGNSSVNTFQHTRHATVEEAVFSMWSVPRGFKRMGIKWHTAVQLSVGIRSRPAKITILVGVMLRPLSPLRPLQSFVANRRDTKDVAIWCYSAPLAARLWQRNLVQ
jgi:hypothetical protein